MKRIPLYTYKLNTEVAFPACAMSVVPIAAIDTDSDTDSSEEDVDSGIADEPATEQRKDVDCMDLSEFFSYW